MTRVLMKSFAVILMFIGIAVAVDLIQQSPYREVKRSVYLDQFKDSDQPRQVIRLVTPAEKIVIGLAYSVAGVVAVMLVVGEVKRAQVYIKSIEGSTGV